MISVTEHERRLRQLPCILSQRTPVTLHHCHGGSMGFRTRARGIAQRAVPWLQIPIHADFHIGRFGIDSGTGVLTWESSFGAQADLLDEVDHILAYPVSIWTLAEQWDHDHRGKSLPWSE